MEAGGIVWKKTQEKEPRLEHETNLSTSLLVFAASFDGNLGQLDPSIKCKNRKTGQAESQA